jgi:methylmalonyl-CoA mutase
VRKIFSPADGQHMGLEQMINLLIRECDVDLAHEPVSGIDDLIIGDVKSLARAITALEVDALSRAAVRELEVVASRRVAPVIGITGTGGSGKSSLIDELVRRFRLDQEDKLRIAVLAADRTKRRSGGALLGDRIRMNAIDSPQIFFRSLATRGSTSEIPDFVPNVITACRAAGYDFIILETPGIGQGDAATTNVADFSLYVMTPEFGAASRLDKIDMLDLADAVSINKFDRRGSDDAQRSVCQQWARSHTTFGVANDAMPVFGTIAARFNDEGTTALYQFLRDELKSKGLATSEPQLPRCVEGVRLFVADCADGAHSVSVRHRHVCMHLSRRNGRTGSRTTTRRRGRRNDRSTHSALRR